jgi:ribosomal protein S12 methylthiotransferase accessory factor
MAPLALDAVLTFKPNLTAETVASTTTYFIGERQRFVVADPRTALLIGNIDGKRTVAQILERVRSRIFEPEALFVLSQLVALGHLVPATPQVAREVAGFWNALGFDSERAVAALRQTPVSVRSVGKVMAAGSVKQALQKAGILVKGKASVRMVIVDDYLQKEIAQINRTALQQGTTWCLIKPTGTRPFVGPIFKPGVGPCWECMAFYLRNNRPIEELVRLGRRSKKPVSLPPIHLQATLQAAAGIASVAMAHALVCAGTHMDHPLFSNLLAVDLTLPSSDYHRVVRRPQCPACGRSSLTAAIGEQPVELRSVEKGYYDDGGYRRQSPRQTYQAFRHLVSPITGPVTHLIPVPGRDTELRAVYASGYMVRPRGQIPATNVFDRGCAGKGCSDDQAKVSALGEALERFSGVCQGDEARVRATTEGLGQQAVRLAELLNFSEEQYRNRPPEVKAATAALNVRRWVPEPLAPTTEIDWAYGWSLTRNERRYVPFAYCYAEAPEESGTAFCHAEGNGVAAGTCPEEALLQGLFELVERDAAGIWWYNRIPRPRFDLASFRDSFIEALMADYARLGWTVWVLDLTHDLGIPVAAAIAHQPREDRFVIGFGCHLDARLAVKRALTELNQLFDPEGASKSPWEAAGVPSRGYIIGDCDSAPTSVCEGPSNLGGDLRAAVDFCIQRLHQAGLELVVVNKTRPDIGLNVVQAIVPGLRHFWPRLGPGRLYSVPCALGWRAAPAAERDLNPVPLFL